MTDRGDILDTRVTNPATGDVERAARLTALCDAGWELWDAFADGDTERPFHPFIPADYGVVRAALWPLRGRPLRFLEWGSATGVITVMADMLGFDAYGIELDSDLVRSARALAERFGSGATFAHGSFLPDGYRWRGLDGDARTGTVGAGRSGYQILNRPLDDFDVVFGYPWDGEASLMLDLMAQFGRPSALLLLHGTNTGVRAFRAGREIASGPWLPPT